jgi:bifunctional UDP-N-acetylglucosamine pyrophosphorylase/glucosamine-1-phosphate N-acetyltransferase
MEPLGHDPYCHHMKPNADLQVQPTGRPLAVVVLAAGKGTRMESQLHKMLQPLAGRPMLEYVLRATLGLSPERTVVVIGHDAEAVSARFNAAGVSFAYQREQLGTGHALLQTRALLHGFDGDILVVNGDAPLLTTEQLKLLCYHHRTLYANMSLLTFRVQDPSGFGRIVRGSDGPVSRIVEQKNCDPITLAINEVNSGLYVFDRKVFTIAEDLRDDNHAREYLITDLVQLYAEAGYKVEAVYGAGDVAAVVGVNDRVQLVDAEKILRNRIRCRWLQKGVILENPESIIIDDTVVIGDGVYLGQGVELLGQTSVGDQGRIGARSVLRDCEIPAATAVVPNTVSENTTF